MSGGGDTATSLPKRRANGNSGRRYQATLFLICVHLRSGLDKGPWLSGHRGQRSLIRDERDRRLGPVASRTFLEVMAWSSESARLTTDDPRDPRSARPGATGSDHAGSDHDNGLKNSRMAVREAWLSRLGVETRSGWRTTTAGCGPASAKSQVQAGEG